MNNESRLLKNTVAVISKYLFFLEIKIRRKLGREWITQELILDILKKELREKKNLRPQKIYDNREVFVREYIPYQGKFYHLTFWFENNNPNWLWVRNCYPIS